PDVGRRHRPTPAAPASSLLPGEGTAKPTSRPPPGQTRRPREPPRPGGKRGPNATARPPPAARARRAGADAVNSRRRGGRRPGAAAGRGAAGASTPSCRLAEGGPLPHPLTRFQTWVMWPEPAFVLNALGRPLPGGAKQTL